MKILPKIQIDMLLIKKGHSKRSFARSFGFSEATIIQVCNGTRNPSPKTAKAIADALEVDFDDIFEIVPAERVAN